MSRPLLPSPACPAVHGRLGALLDHLDTRPLHGQRIFVTGGTGFFGYWLLSLFDLLHRQGVALKVCVLSRQPARFLARAPFFADTPWLEWQQGDVKDFGALPPTDLLIHAATDTDAAAHRHPLAIMDDILLGTRHTLGQARESGVRRALYVSSGAVYGRQPADVERIPEDAAFACDALHPGSAYGEAKRAAEQWCLQYGLQHGIDIPVARCFAFVGATLPLDGHFAIGNFIRDALTGQDIHVGGDGSPLRSYLYGADLAIWLLTLLLQGQHGRAYNVGADQAVSIAELASRVRDTLAPDAAVHIACGRDDKAERNRYVPTIARARQELALDAWTPLEQAIRFTADCAPSEPQTRTATPSRR
ncbi:NAD(P)-dependent oxidoreductase [Zoogloea sp.]|uniref:NAD-dependent epimerase/dehydratase family protein n=1 Tax=Zoogloea sp. TaxID=49181 RepID=UPI0025EA84DB|nr:NAD(P)-dependent oxidoreductase [Zoogloea sp.]MCK6394350.1 NAD(P)-dependent oxidoreductase [Zoogloea sp.]